MRVEKKTGSRLPAPRGRRLDLAFVLAVAALAALSAWDPDGLRKHLRLAGEAKRLTAENKDLAQENARLRREVRALDGDPTALERAAREELGYVKPGEIVFKFAEPDRRAPAATTASSGVPGNGGAGQ